MDHEREFWAALERANQAADRGYLRTAARHLNTAWDHHQVLGGGAGLTGRWDRT